MSDVQVAGDTADPLHLLAKLDECVLAELKQKRNVSAIAYFFNAHLLELNSTSNGTERTLDPGTRCHKEAKVLALLQLCK